MLDQLRRTICRIPKGRVATYGDVARAAGYPGAARQVAWALHNAKGGIPWHRVLGAGGHIRLPGHGVWSSACGSRRRAWPSAATAWTWLAMRSILPQNESGHDGPITLSSKVCEPLPSCGCSSRRFARAMGKALQRAHRSEEHTSE